MANEIDYVELGLTCTDVCKTFGRGTDEKKPEDLNQLVREAIAQFKAWVNPVVDRLDGLLMILLIIALWRRSRRRSLKRASGI